MFYPQKVLHHWMFPRQHSAWSPTKAIWKKRSFSNLTSPPACPNTRGSRNKPKVGSQFVWIMSHSGEVLSGKPQAPLLLSSVAAAARSSVLSTESGKNCADPPVSSGISLFPTPATCCLKHTPSNDMVNMELNSARNSHFSLYPRTMPKFLMNICRSWKTCL